MLENLPKLAFLPVADLVIHEWHDEQRTPPLIDRIRASGVFRNPPIVAPLPDSSGRYIVLDGANRITALRKMDFPHALVQVVQPDDPGLQLENWNHVVWGLDPSDFLASLRAVRDLELVVCDDENEQPNLWGDCDLALVQVPNDYPYAVCTSAVELVVRVARLNAIIDCYKDRTNFDRTSARQVDHLLDIYPDLCGLVIFPHFDVAQVMQLAGAGYRLPAGITRFTVSPRALHLDYPLEALASDQPIAEKNAALQQWIQESIARKRVRYYAEATFLFDE
jgi:hypothetical protein